MNFEKSEAFCTKKCGRPHLEELSNPLVQKTSALDKPPPPDVFYGRPLRIFTISLFLFN